MNLLKLMKELYLIDRESIKERDSSVSGDVYFSMPHGPVLSQTLNMLRDLPGNKWGDYLEEIKIKYDHSDIQMKKSIDFDRLSTKDTEYIKIISDKFKNYTPKKLEAYTHTLDEWIDPKGSSKKIHFSEVMRALGKTEDEIVSSKTEYEQFNSLLESM